MALRRDLDTTDVFFKDDVQCMLQAILATNEELARQFPDAQVQNYRHGFAAAIAAVAVACNIRLEAPAFRQIAGFQ